MCDKAEFAALRERIGEIEKSNAAQTAQIGALCESVRDLKITVQGAFSKLLWVCVIVMLLAVGALIYGALGDKGFHAVTNAAKPLVTEGK